MSKPNIVFITTDQHRADCYSFARSDIRTPHIDSIAARGTRFDRCYCPSPICQPARASLLTGVLPHTHGVRDNGIDLPDDMIERGFATQAARQGYHTALLGKAHLSTQHTFERTGRPECRYTMAEYYDGWFGPYMGFDHVELFIDGPVKWPYWEPPLGLHFTRWLHETGAGTQVSALYDQGARPASGAQQVHTPELPLNWHTSSWLGDRATDFITNYDEQEPFLLWVSFPDPHHPFDPPSPWDKMYDPEDVDLPKHRDLDVARRPWWHEASLTSTPQTNEEFRAIRENLSRQRRLTDRQLRDITAAYFGMISLVDHSVGRILSALKARGIDENTIIVVSADHGEYLGDHGLLFKGPMLYDSLTRVGLIAAGPGIAENKVVNQVVSTLDIAPTFVDFAGGVPRDYHGESLKPVLRTGEAKADMRNFAFIEWGLGASRCGIDLDLQTIVTQDYRCTFEMLSNEGEMYDLRQDPYEMNNVFDEPDHADGREKLDKLRSDRPDDKRSTPLQAAGMC
ncbi:sulfatase-like hydrolase/transferase [Hoeflea sp. CAU 1731]